MTAHSRNEGHDPFMLGLSCRRNNCCRPGPCPPRWRKHVEVRTWADDNDIELGFLATYGSWLNWIESGFAALRYFALNGTDHRSHGEQNAAIAAYIRRRNARAEPKTNFTPDSPVRPWTESPSRARLHSSTIFV
ncbi:hypothetical protein ACWCXB_34285 [Streptomyces sp. NPDC001514]